MIDVGDKKLFAYDRDLDEMIRQDKKRADGCSRCKEFGSVPIRGFTLHGCTSMTV